MRAGLVFLLGAVCAGGSILVRGDSRGFLVSFGLSIMVAAGVVIIAG